MPIYPAGQNLLIDADDTLWENNIYFERAIAAFIAYLNHKKCTPAEVRKALNAVEHEHILSYGYGLGSFTRSLLVCYERLTARPLSDGDRERITGFANAIRTQQIELLPGVQATLQDLATRHRLILMTKGVHAEQTDKLSRSGLANLFDAVEVVAEKDPATYAQVIDRHKLNPAISWMIGNSPKSDVNPALAAGLNAVFLFHNDTWVLEHADLATAPEGRTLHELDGFAHLAEIF